MLPARPLAIVAACALLACGSSATLPRSATAVGSELHVFAEGPCPKLSVQAIGRRRLIVYGDTGYDLRAWMPGDELPAAQAIVELKGDRVFHHAALLSGLPTDARGYVTGALELGGGDEDAGWLRRITTRYDRSSAGALFERRSTGYLWGGAGWQRAGDGEPVSRPPQARALPALPHDTMCPQPQLKFIPMASTVSPAGGLFIAGRCDDERPTNYLYTTILVAHGSPQAKSWAIGKLPDADALNGIVNIGLFARSDEEAYLVAYEPFEQREDRRPYFARYDGARWRKLDAGVEEGLMSVTGTADGSLWVAAGRALYRRRPTGEMKRVDLPPLRYARGRSSDLHIHTVRAFDGEELWVEASYRVAIRGPKGRAEVIWASAVFSSQRPSYPLYCDVREPAESAIYEVE